MHQSRRWCIFLFIGAYYDTTLYQPQKSGLQSGYFQSAGLLCIPLNLNLDLAAVLEDHSHFALRMNRRRFDGGKPKFLIELIKQPIALFQVIQESSYLFPLRHPINQLDVGFGYANLNSLVSLRQSIHA